MKELSQDHQSLDGVSGWVFPEYRSEAILLDPA
jgi:hypothetical protein